jgi:general secretion pathway protein J
MKIAINVKMKTKGFTLFEILVAIFILAIIGVIMVRGLQIITISQERVTQNAEQLEQVNLALTILKNDINNIVDRSITVGNNTTQAAISLNNDAEDTLEFTRGGLSNPMSALRSNLLRVDYQNQQGKLVRLIWPTLDRLPQEKPITRVLLSNIQQLQWEFLGSDHRFYPVWPVLNESLPQAVRVTITFTNAQVIQILFTVNNAGNQNRRPGNAMQSPTIPVY